MLHRYCGFIRQEAHIASFLCEAALSICCRLRSFSCFANPSPHTPDSMHYLRVSKWQKSFIPSECFGLGALRQGYGHLTEAHSQLEAFEHKEWKISGLCIDYRRGYIRKEPLCVYLTQECNTPLVDIQFEREILKENNPYHKLLPKVEARRDRGGKVKTKLRRDERRRRRNQTRTDSAVLEGVSQGKKVTSVGVIKDLGDVRISGS